MTHPLVTGPMGGTPIVGDPAVLRLEIRDFVKSKYNHTLLIRALRTSQSCSGLYTLTMCIVS